MSLILLFLVFIIIFIENHSGLETLYFRIESGRPGLLSETIRYINNYNYTLLIIIIVPTIIQFLCFY